MKVTQPLCYRFAFDRGLVNLLVLVLLEVGGVGVLEVLLSVLVEEGPGDGVALVHEAGEDAEEGGHLVALAVVELAHPEEGVHDPPEDVHAHELEGKLKNTRKKLQKLHERHKNDNLMKGCCSMVLL